MLSERLENTLRNAFEIAGNNGHEYATLEHLLLALLDDEDANEVLVSCDVDLKELRSVLIDFINNELSSLKVKNIGEVKPTASFQRVIQRAVHHVQNSGNGKATGATQDELLRLKALGPQQAPQKQRRQLAHPQHLRALSRHLGCVARAWTRA